MKLKMKRVNRSVAVNIIPANEASFIGSTGESYGPIVFGSSEPEVKLKMVNALKTYSAITSLINAINLFNSGKDKKKSSPSGEIIHYVAA